MELNYKMLCILEMLFAAGGKIAICDLMSTLEISRRSLTYNLDKINDFLGSIGAANVEVQRGQLVFDMKQKEWVRQALSTQEELCYVMSREERRTLMTISLTIQPELITIDGLATMLGVSRNTVVTEIADLRDYLAEHGITLISYGKRGYRLEGDETTVRYLLMESFYDIASNNVQSMAEEMLHRAVGRVTGQALTQDALEGLKELVAYSEKYTEAYFNNNSLDEVVQYLLFILVRAADGHTTGFRETLSKTREYEAAGIILEQMNKTGLPIAQSEQTYITAVLLASKVYDANAEHTQDTLHIRCFVEDLINTFSAKVCVGFENYEELIERLLLHVRPMFYRLKYHIKVKNVLTKEIKIKYRELYNMTDLAVKTIQGKYGFIVPDDEIAYLCVYIGGWMNRQALPKNSGGLPKILIVCGAGVGTSLLLKQQISSLLGSGYLYETKDERETNRTDTSAYQLIVTTLNLSHSGDNVIVVNPILTTVQQNKLLAWSVERNDSKEEYKVGDVLEIVRRYADVRNEQALINALLEYLTLGKKPEPLKRVGMKELLKKRHIKIVKEQIDYKAAIDLSCNQLIADGVVKESYAQSILEIVDTLGLYAEIASGVLLAHGKPTEEATGVGITITLLKHPVVFQKWDKEIRVLVTLATKDNQSHLDILRDMMKLFANADNRKKMTQCEFSDEQEVYDFIQSTVL